VLNGRLWLLSRRFHGGWQLRLRRRLVTADEFRRNTLRHARDAIREHRFALARQRLLRVQEIFEVLASRERKTERKHAGNSHQVIEATHSQPQFLLSAPSNAINISA
jgi:hypothetical protein